MIFSPTLPQSKYLLTITPPACQGCWKKKDAYSSIACACIVPDPRRLRTCTFSQQDFASAP
jgi:hypothetical protein